MAIPLAAWIGVTVASAYSAYRSSQDTNEANRRISEQQMSFQEQMSSTSYQRGQKDLKTAGLNPALAYTQGGASAPSGAGIPAIDPAEKALMIAMNVANINADLQLKDAQTQSTSATALNTQAQTRAINQSTARTALPSKILSDIDEGYSNVKRKFKGTQIGKETINYWNQPDIPMKRK